LIELLLTPASIAAQHSNSVVVSDAMISFDQIRQLSEQWSTILDHSRR